MFPDSLDELDFDNIRNQIEVNTLGPLRITKTLDKNLSSGSKIFIISSYMGSIEENKSGNYYGYKMSKAAVNMVGVNLSKDLFHRNILVQLLHPGVVETDMTFRLKGKMTFISPQESASKLIHRMQIATIEETGKFYHINGDEIPW